jgi:hypothetical protein
VPRGSPRDAAIAGPGSITATSPSAQDIGVRSPKVIGEGFGASTRRRPGEFHRHRRVLPFHPAPPPIRCAHESPFAWIKKRFVPRGIYARAALILIVPVLAVQLVVSSVFIQRHYENVTEQMALALSLDLNLILDTYARDGAEAGHGCGRRAG